MKLVILYLKLQLQESPYLIDSCRLSIPPGHPTLYVSISKILGVPTYVE